MSKILIPRSDSISAKTIVPTDFEKYFENVIRDHVVSGFTVTGSSGTNRDVDITSGTVRLKGMFISNSANDTNAYTFSTDDTHYLYVQITRDGNGEPESWDYTSNTTGTTPTDAIMIAKVVTAAGDVSSVDQSTEFKKVSHMHTFVGTGAEINALTPTYEGQLVFCMKSGNGFGKNIIYVRNGDNSAWNPLSINQLTYIVPSTTIGDYTTPTDSVASSTGDATVNVSGLIVGGGGSGGTGYNAGNLGWGGGGGAGGGVYNFTDALSIASYTVTVGAGGSSSNGGDSSFNGKIAYGGDAGQSTVYNQGAGAGGDSNGTNLPYTGYTGGAAGQLEGGGGAGAGQNGSQGVNSPSGYAGAGGNGVTSTITGSTVYYGGGGGGQGGYSAISGAYTTGGGTGGSGGGGNGISGSGSGGAAGTANTGGGGGGGGYAGGSGIVIIRYVTGTCTATGGTTSTSGIYTLHTFTSSGTFQITATDTYENIYDQDTATNWISASEANPNIYVDIGSTQEIVGIALNINRTPTTIESFKIRASTTTSFSDSDNIAYIDIADFTDDTWRFIPFNLSTTNKRYIQFYGVGTGVFAINEVKIRYGLSDYTKLITHAHGTRDTSATSAFADTN